MAVTLSKPAPAAPSVRRSLRVFLPEGWGEEGTGQGRERVFHTSDGGTLVMTVMPPLDATAGEALDRRLRAMVQRAALPMIISNSTLGRLAACAHKTEKGNVGCLWISAGAKGTVFATYEREQGPPQPAELTDAQAIVESVDLD